MYEGEILGATPAQWTTGLLGKIGAAAGSTLLNDLVAYWPLDEQSGTRADVGDYDLTDNNTVLASNAGPSGTVARFVKANGEYLSITDNDDVSINGSKSWAFWLNVGAGNSYASILDKRGGGAVEYVFYTAAAGPR